MDFGGDLSVIDPASVFQIFNLASNTGALKLVTLRNVATFYFKDGELIYAHVDSKMKLAKYLVERGLITESQREAALKAYQHERGSARVGEVMINRRFLSKQDLESAIRDRMKEIFYEILKWRSGKFIFFNGAEADEEDVLLDVKLDHLILEGLRRRDEESQEVKEKKKGKK